MERSFRILVVHNKYRFSGGEDSVVFNEINMLKSHGHSVTLYQKENTEIDSYSFLQKLFLPLKTLYSYSSYRDISRIIKREKIDIVHVHNTLPLISFSSYYAAKHADCALVQTIHNFRFLCPNGIFYRDNHICEDCLKSFSCAIKYNCYRNSKSQTALVALNLWSHRKIGTFHLPDAYIALTDFNRQKLTALLPESKVFVKPNFTPPTDFASQPKSRDYFIYVSRLEKNKGFDLLLEVFLGLPKHKLVIVGTGPAEKYIREFILEHHMNNVEVKGFVNHDATLSLLYNAKALLFPTQWYEGFPVVIAESFSVGTPVIGSDLGNTASIIKHGKTGLLFQHNSAKDFLSQITVFLSKSFDFRSMEENCLDSFHNNYSPDQNYQQLMSIYQKITARKL